jgi:hypothetical protein
LDACNQVTHLHASGKAAYIKSIRPKELAVRVPIGRTIHEVIGELVYNFIDSETPLLMVQEFQPMCFEHRFFIIGREVVVHSPNALVLTPLDFVVFDNSWLNFGFATPKSTFYKARHIYRSTMVDLVRKIARTMEFPDAVVDIAWVNEDPVVVKFNQLVVGGVKLFACDVRGLAEAIIRRDEK